MYVKPTIVEEKFDINDIVASSSQIVGVDQYPVGHYVFGASIMFIPNFSIGFIIGACVADLFNNIAIGIVVGAILTITCEALYIAADIFENNE